MRRLDGFFRPSESRGLRVFVVERGVRMIVLAVMLFVMGAVVLDA